MTATPTPDDGLTGMVTRMANGTFSYATPPGAWPGTDISYDATRVNAAIEYTAASGVSASASVSVTRKDRPTSQWTSSKGTPRGDCCSSGVRARVMRSRGTTTERSDSYGSVWVPRT
jgi:hypothetical protein